MNTADILAHVRTLSRAERIALMKDLIDTLDAPEDAPPQYRLSDLRGLGADIWEGIDAQEYVNQLRSEWDDRP